LSTTGRKNVWRDLETEKVHPGARRLDRLPLERIITLMQRDDLRVLACLRKARPEIVRASRMLRQSMISGATCWLCGAGTSGRLAVLEAAELPPTFGTNPKRIRAVIAGGPSAVLRAREGAEDRFDEGARAVDRARPGDLVVGISASSVTPFVRGALERGRKRGAGTVLLTASGSAGLQRLARIVVRLRVGPEVIAGSTRLKAGTATKLALNQITTAALASSGKVFGAWMVDLRAGSAKLRDRALRIVAAATGAAPRKARLLLNRAKGEVKTAIVMGRRNVSQNAARALLERSHGDLRSALENPR
jgi:N-acetylmuramic acid 6-phosphate etherase